MSEHDMDFTCGACGKKERGTYWIKHHVCPPTPDELSTLRSRLAELERERDEARATLKHERDRCRELYEALQQERKGSPCARCAELERTRQELSDLQQKYDWLKGDRDGFLMTDDCYYWTPEGQKARDADRKALKLANLTNEALRGQCDRYREALAAVWNNGVCAGALKDQVRDALWPKAALAGRESEGK
jgi:hypothetical protein